MKNVFLHRNYCTYIKYLERRAFIFSIQRAYVPTSKFKFDYYLRCWLFQSQTICWNSNTVQNEPKHYCNNKLFINSYRYLTQKITYIKVNHILYFFSFLFPYEEDYWEEFFLHWGYLKYFSLTANLACATMGVVLLLNIIEYNNNRHIK